MLSLGVSAFVVYRVDQAIIINVLVDCLDFVSCCVHAHRMHLPYVLVSILEYTQLCFASSMSSPFPL